MGHLAKDCWSPAVQQVASDAASTASGPSVVSSSASSSASSVGTSVSSAKPKVNRVGAFEPHMPMIVELDDSDREIDLTIFALESDCEQTVNMVQFSGCTFHG